MRYRKKLWKLLIDQIILSVAHIFWRKHKVGQNEQKVPQNDKKTEIYWVEIILIDLYRHNEEDKLLSQNNKCNDARHLVSHNMYLIMIYILISTLFTKIFARDEHVN